MKDFPDPQVTITKEEHDQLMECKAIMKELHFENVIMSNNSKKWDIPEKLRWRLDALFDMDGP